MAFVSVSEPSYSDFAPFVAPQVGTFKVEEPLSPTVVLSVGALSVYGMQVPEFKMVESFSYSKTRTPKVINFRRG